MGWEGERVGIDRRIGVGEGTKRRNEEEMGESGDRYGEWGWGGERVGIGRGNGV